MKHVSRDGLIGEGGFGIAYKVRIKQKSKFYVEKIYKNTSKRFHNSVIAEVSLLTFAYEFMPKMIFCGFNQDGNWCLITEFISGGTLMDHILSETENKAVITPEAKRTIAYEIAKAVDFLHARNLTHG